MEYIDLHVHSTESDGTYTPEQLVDYACEKGLYAFALTDHDTVSGLAKAYSRAINLPVYVIPGIELSSEYEGNEIHVLGYNFNWHSESLLKALDDLKRKRFERNERMIASLNKHGIHISIMQLKKRFPDSVLTRANFAKLMAEEGYVKDKNEAFELYLGIDAPCYVPRNRPSLIEAAKIIRIAGGKCSIAHPVQYKLDDEGYNRLFQAAKRAGIGGIEAIYSTNTFEDDVKFTQYARDYGFFITGGSDFHGDIKPDIDLGTGRGNLMIPRSLLANIGY